MKASTLACLVGPPPFRPAPRQYAGNMCGVRVAGIEPVPGGAADPSLVLSWFYDRYTSASQVRIRAAWGTRYPDVLLSWPDSRAAGFSPAAFGQTCRSLLGYGFRPAVMLSSKAYDPHDDLHGILANIQPVVPHLLGVVPRICLGWELSLWMSPETCQSLIDAVVPPFLASGCKTYVHFQSGYFAYQPDGEVTAAFWQQNVGKLTGIFRQRDPAEDWNESTEQHDPAMYQARVKDCLDRFAGQDFFPTDSGFGHPFDLIELEITAEDQFGGNLTEAEGDSWGRAALATPPTGSVRVMGSGNGF